VHVLYLQESCLPISPPVALRTRQIIFLGTTHYNNSLHHCLLRISYLPLCKSRLSTCQFSPRHTILGPLSKINGIILWYLDCRNYPRVKDLLRKPATSAAQFLSPFANVSGFPGHNMGRSLRINNYSVAECH